MNRPFYRPVKKEHIVAYTYLEGWLYRWRKTQIDAIAHMFRNNPQDSDRISIVNMLNYYESALPNHATAFGMLDSLYSSLPGDVKDHFMMLFNGKQKMHSHKSLRWVGSPRPDYQSQNDNLSIGGLQPWNTCNVSATAMMLDSLERSGVNITGGAPEDVQLQRWVHDSGYNSSTNHDVINKICRDRLGVIFDFLYDASYSDLDRELEKGHPVVLGILHKGHWSEPYGGHMITIFGKVRDGLYVGHDPFGSPPNYDDWDGADVLYDREKTLKGRWQAFDPQDNAGWMRRFVRSK